MAGLTAWLTQHKEWIQIAVGVVAFVESLAIAGLIVPGVAILFAVCLAGGNLHLALEPLLIAAVIGAVLGDGISFWLGHHYKDRIRALSIWQKHPDWLPKGEAFFTTYGPLSLVAGRFVGPLRPIVPMVAGMLNMNPRHYIVINGLSALAWAPLYVVPGYYVGRYAETLEIPWQYWALGGGILLALWAIWLLYKKKSNNHVDIQ